MRTILRHARRIPWKKLGIIVVIAAPVLMVIVQCVYPSDRTMLYARADGIAIGGVSRDEATTTIRKAYEATPLTIYFGEAELPYRSPTLGELGVSMSSETAVERAMYPLWLRLVPTSLWWGHATVKNEVANAQLETETIRAYAEKELGESCQVDPKNASVVVEGDALKLVPSEDGGTCEMTEVVTRLEQAKLSISGENAVRIPTKRIAPKVTDTDAEKLMETISAQLAGGIDLTFGDTTIRLDAATVRPWLVFTTEKDALVATVDRKKAKDTLEKEVGQKVAKKAGVVTITTRDFVEVSRTGGADGRVLNVGGTADSIAKYLMKQTETVHVATTAIPAQRKYIRSYSSTDTGLSALIQHYADTHKGIYGVSLVELSGQRRRAGHNEHRKFTTASTYKVYVAYSTLKRVESGQFKWSDQIAGGRDLAKCFDDMIVLSDNPCAEELVKKISYNSLHADVQTLGLGGTSFIDTESFKTTAADLSTFMASLESNQLSISKVSRDRLIGALKRNVYRQGIPAGTVGAVANKVGFIDALLHDTAVVYSPSGTYVLTIMTDGSSWANIAELTREIEKLQTK